MSETPHPPPSTENKYRVKDVVMWRKKRISVGVITMATVLWVVMEVYGFNFITVASWMAIFLVSSLFLWANIFNLIYKEEPSMSALGISESTAAGMANGVRELSEEAAKWMFKVGAESEWYVFAATVAGLWLLSVVGSSSDFLTLAYFGSMVGMTVPVIWVKYDHKIREYGERVQMQSKRLYSIINEKLNSKVKLKSSEEGEEAKKVE